MTDQARKYGQGAIIVLDADVQQRLARDCIAGKQAAQKEFYETYSPMLYGIIRRYLYNKDAAGELLNDTFFKVFSKLDQYGFRGSLEGWMRKIAINCITDHLRRTMKYKNETPVEMENVNAYVDEGQVSKLSYKELLGYVHALPDMQRTIFNLYVFEDLPHKEIAALINITETNCRWYLNDARRRLKNQITNHM